MSNITNNTASSRFSEYTLDDYSTCKATANKTSPSANRVVAAMQATAHKVVTAFSYAAAFLSNMVLSVANLAIRAANFMHGRIFTKEAPAAKPVEIELEPKKEVLTITHVEPPKAPEQKEVLTITYVEPPKAPEQKDVLTITHVETQTASEQLAATEKSADQTAPKEEAPAVVDPKKDEATSLPHARGYLQKTQENISNFLHTVLNDNSPKFGVSAGVGLATFSIGYAAGFSALPSILAGAGATAIGFGIAKGAQPFYAYAMDKLDF